jgi:hypothetical protein
VSYLNISAFSRVSLTKQLQYEGYSAADAGWAIDHIQVNWNDQAAKSAKSYMKISAFSRQSLTSQLIYEGFTPAEAQYGVSQTGL